MTRLKCFCLFGLVFLMLISMITGCAVEDEVDVVDEEVDDEVDDDVDVVDPTYPERPINMIIHWGAGGRTDLLGRSLGAPAEKELGQPFVYTNITGATGAVGMQAAYDATEDGYTVGMFAENPALYRVTGISERCFDEFDPIIITTIANAVLLVSPDSPYDSIEELIEDAIERPGELLLGTGGPACEAAVVAAFLSESLGTKFSHVVMGGDHDNLIAVMAGETDLTVIGLPVAMDMIRAGDVRALAVIHDEEIDVAPDVPPITQSYPELEEYLPWAPFYGVYVKKGTPDDIQAILTDAFLKATEDPEYQEFLDGMAISSVNLIGDDARSYLESWRSLTAWTMWDAGAAENSPEEFGIPRP